MVTVRWLLVWRLVYGWLLKRWFVHRWLINWWLVKWWLVNWWLVNRWLLYGRLIDRRLVIMGEPWRGENQGYKEEEKEEGQRSHFS